jgi:3-deoxy-D-manno-octulosonic-acid transferase
VAEPFADLVLAGYRLLGEALRPLVPFALALRARRGKEDRGRFGERYGRASLARPAGRFVWVHAASVGETNAVLPLIARLTGAGLQVVFTSTTLTSAAIAVRGLPSRAVHQFGPLDVASFVDRFLAHWRPELVIFVESELWPTIVTRLAATGVPLAIVNARLSQRSFRGWSRFASVARALFSRIGLTLAQSDEDAARFASLGAGNVLITGNLKFDAPPLAAAAGDLDRLITDIGQRPVWVAASTHEGEEEMVAEAHRILRVNHPGILTVIVPRHPERGDALRAMLAGRRLSLAQRSRGEPLVREVDVYLADTLGELGLFYRVAPVAFLGGSLVAHGGQNPIEPTRLGTAVLHGPHVHNFADIYSRLDAALPSAAIADGRGLAMEVGRLLANPKAAADRAAAAVAALAPLSGALDLTMRALQPYLAGESPSP